MSFKATCPDNPFELTDYQLQVMTLFFEGLQGPEVAKKIGKSKGSVNDARKQAYRKMQVNNYADMVKKLGPHLKKAKPKATDSSDDEVGRLMGELASLKKAYKELDSNFGKVSRRLQDLEGEPGPRYCALCQSALDKMADDEKTG